MKKYLNLGSDFEEGKKVSNFSKSSINVFKTCELKAWKRHRDYKTEKSRALDIGSAAHEYFAKNIQKLNNKRYKINLSYEPDILREAKAIADNVNYDKLLENSKILFVEHKISVTLPNQQNLVGINDLVLYHETELGNAIKIVDFKTGFKVSKDIDTEAMIYAYLGAKKYNLPIIFQRISGRSNDSFEHFFSIDEALSFEPLLSEYIDHVKEVLEHDESPFPNVGVHCQECPYLDDCIAKKYDISDIDEMYVQQKMYEQKARELKKKIKDLTLASELEYTESDQYIREIQVSKTPKIQKNVNGKVKSLSKKAILHELAKAGLLNNLIDSLDITLTDEVIQTALELGYDLGHQTRQDVKITKHTEKDL